MHLFLLACIFFANRSHGFLVFPLPPGALLQEAFSTPPVTDDTSQVSQIFSSQPETFLLNPRMVFLPTNRQTRFFLKKKSGFRGPFSYEVLSPPRARNVICLMAFFLTRRTVLPAKFPVQQYDAYDFAFRLFTENFTRVWLSCVADTILGFPAPPR